MRLSTIPGFVASAMVLAFLAAPAARAGQAAKKKADPKKEDEQKKAEEELKQTLDALKANAKARMPADQKNALKKLDADMKKWDGTDEGKKKLQEQVVAVLKGANTPSEESVNKLAAEITSFSTEGKLTSKETPTIIEDATALLYSAGITDQQIKAVKSDVDALISKSKLSPRDISKFMGSFDAFCASAKENPPKPPPKK